MNHLRDSQESLYPKIGGHTIEKHYFSFFFVSWESFPLETVMLFYSALGSTADVGVFVFPSIPGKMGSQGDDWHGDS